MGPKQVNPVAICLQDTTTSQQQPQQPDKVGTQITLLKTGCLEALLYLSTASSVIIRIQVLLYFHRQHWHYRNEVANDLPRASASERDHVPCHACPCCKPFPLHSQHMNTAVCCSKALSILRIAVRCWYGHVNRHCWLGAVTEQLTLLSNTLNTGIEVYLAADRR